MDGAKQQDSTHVFVTIRIVVTIPTLPISLEVRIRFFRYRHQVVDSVYQCGYSDNDPNGDKHMRTVYDIIPDGNFRSALVDDWFLDPPHEVRLCRGVVTKLKQI
jgi:hypothetical protein